MDNRRVLTAMTVIGMLICLFPVSIDSSSDASSELDGVLLYEINAKGKSEGVTLKNYGSTSVQLKNWIISDHPTLENEGYLKFTGNYTLAAASTITIVTSEDKSDSFLNNRPYIVADSNGTNGVTKYKVGTGNFTLSNDKDDVYLFNSNGTLVDTIYYGSLTEVTTILKWNGNAASISSDNPIQRYWDTDNDNAYDWTKVPEGWTYNQFDEKLTFDVKLTPFLFPDHGGVPIYRALENAQESVFINMYRLSSKNVFGLLIDLEERGVDVTILYDAGNLGWNSKENDIGCLKKLVDAGGEVRFMNSDSKNRFIYNHAKYCIIDETITIVTTENWVTDNMNGSVITNPYVSDNGNRGWGAIIEDADYAAYMKDVFDNDYSMEYEDVCTFNDYINGINYTKLNPYYVSPTYQGAFASYQCNVTPMFSPDSSLPSELYYIEKATKRVYTEQQSTSATLAVYENNNLILNGPMLALKESAANGIDVRYIVSSGTDSMDDGRSLSLLLNTNTSIKATYMSTPTVHNKGLICDDTVIITSVNWTMDSFQKNRECGVIIYSKAIADYFAESFLKDFDRNYDYDGPRAVFTEFNNNPMPGDVVTFTVEVLPANRTYSYVWEFGDGSEPYTTTIPRTSDTVSQGTFTVTVTAVDVSDPTFKCTVSKQYTAGDNSFDLSIITDNMEYVLPILVIILGIIVKVLRR